MKKITISLLSIFILFQTHVFGQTTIVNYDFNAGSTYATLTPTLTSGITCTATSTEAFATFGGIATTGAAFTTNSTAGNAIAMNNSSGTNTRYFEFGMAGSNLLNYSTFKIYLQAQRSGAGAQIITIQYSLNGGAYTTFSSNTMSPGNGSFSAATINLPSAVDNPNTSLAIRLFASGASGAGTLRIDNFQVQGVLGTPATSTVTIAGNDPNASQVNWALSSANNIFYTATVTPAAANATLSSVSAVMGGNYSASDISASGFKLWYSPNSNLSSSVQIGSSVSSSTGAGETISWTGLSQAFTQSTAGYIFATADIAGAATQGNILTGSFTSDANIVFSPTVSYGSNTYGSTVNKVFAALPTNPTTFNLNCASQANIKINLNAPTIGSVLVFANTNGSFTTPTGAGSGFTGANNNYSSATNYPAVGGNLVYSGAGSNFTVTGLTAGQNYSFKAYSYNGSNWSSGTSVINGTATTQPVTATVVTPSSGQLQLSWTNPTSTACNNNVIVIARQGSAVESAVSKANFDGLVSDADFTGANAVWTSNSNTNDVYDLTASLIGTDNTNYLVYKGTGTSVTLTGLTNGTPYYFRIFTVDGTGSLARWSAAVDANGTPDLPAYYWNGGSISALPAAGGSGTWGTTNAWRQPGASGSQATWANNNSAIFAGTAGLVTLDADRTATSYSFNTTSYTLQTTSTTARTLTGPLVIGNNNELVIAPNFPTSANGTIGFGSISGSGSASVTLFANQASGAAARVNIAVTNGTVSVPTSIVSTSGNGVAGYVATVTGAVISGNIVNNSAVTTILGATSGNDITMNGIISGSAGLQISAGPSGGAGKVTLSNNNTYTGPTLLNATNSGKLVLGINNALPPAADLVLGFSSGNGGILDLNGFNQTVANITDGVGGGSITNSSSSSNSTLTVTQSTVGSFGLAITNGTSMTTALAKSGSSVLTLNGTGYTFSGGLYISAGELRFNPSSSAYTLSSCPVVMNGGTLGTSGISASSAPAFSTLNVANNSTISLATSITHTLNFAASNALTWTPSKTLTIVGWQGTYTTSTGSSGTAGKIVVGTGTTALTSTQLSQIKFYDGSSYYDAILLSNGELVPYQISVLTQLNSSYCNYTAMSPAEFIWADSIGSPTVNNNYRYKFKLINGSTTFTWQTTNEWPIFQFYFMPASSFTFNTPYVTSVAWSSDNGATFSAYGPTCTLTSPVNATTQLSAGYCGITVSSYSQIIYADNVAGATQYEYRLTNSALSYTQSYVKPQSNFNLTQFTGLTNGTTYSVSVRTFIYNAWDVYGPVCTITTPASQPTTSLSASNCGITASSYSQILYADAVTGATQYEYRLINSALSYTQSYAKPQSNFNLTQLPNLVNGTTYSVSVRVFFNNAWGAYGPVCTITTPASQPTTSLSASNCGITASLYSQILYADAVTGATQYEYRLINSALSYTQSYAKPQSNFNLTQLPNLVNGTTYSVSVRVFFNNAWGAYGPVCTITTPASSPTTVLQPSYCSFAAPSFSTIIFATAVTGATQYEYLLTNASLGYSQSYAKPQANFNLAQFTGLALSTTYTVQVRVFFNNAWGSYGSNCMVVTPASAMLAASSLPLSAREVKAPGNTESITDAFEAVLYPNPYKDVFMINLTSYHVNDAVSVSVFDATGRLIEQHNTTPHALTTMSMGADYIPGMYNIIISHFGQIKNVKMIKQ